MNNFIERDGEEVFKEEFLEFAGYNLQRRAIPDARDGLKWGARQLIYSQHIGGFRYDKPFKKAIKSVSQAMGFCYLHGDASAYGTFIRMAKPFAYRYPLQEANGNYGTLINPDDHSASRYVELRGSKLASLLLNDIDKDTITDWEDTYDLEGQFPKVLPSKSFYGIVNGCISIGSGMSCSIPPTNLREVNKALENLLLNPDAADDEIICYPDFPTGATILNKTEVRQSMLDGHGFACKVRAIIEFDEKERCLIVKELPYSTYTNTICNELAALIDKDENCGIDSFVDYTGKKPDLRIYLTKKASVSKVIKLLYKETSLQTHFTINMVMLDKGTSPRVFTWREALQAHIDHELEVYRRGFEFDLHKIENRIHIIDGILTCLARIEEVVATIKASSSTAIASSALQKNFLLDEVQAKAVLDMKLSRLAHLEVKKLEDERHKLESEKERIQEILNDKQLLNNELIKGWRATAQTYGDERRTNIIDLEADSTNDPVEIKQLQLSLTNRNNCFISESSTLYTQKRGGTGTKIKLANNEVILSSIQVKNTDQVLFFDENGNYYAASLLELQTNVLMPLEALIKCDGRHIIAMSSISNPENQYIMFITKNGYLKKSLLTEYNTNRKDGIKAIALEKDDKIIQVILSNGQDKCGILTKQGNFLMFSTEPIHPIGRVAKGIKAIKLNDGDYVVSSKSIRTNAKSIISITESGLIKQTNINEFNCQGTNTKGSKIQKLEDDFMADFLPISDASEITIAATASLIKIKTNEIPVSSKGTVGVHAIKLNAKNKVQSLN